MLTKENLENEGNLYSACSNPTSEVYVNQSQVAFLHMAHMTWATEQEALAKSTLALPYNHTKDNR